LVHGGSRRGGVLGPPRSGSIDPGILVYLLRQKGLNADQLDYALNYESGLLGVSGVSSDMRQILAAMPQHAGARLAIDVYVHRIRQTVGAMAATLGGVDALVFTAGVGEQAAELRARVCENMGYLGLALDHTANDVYQPDADVALPASTGRILIMATREDVTIMRETRQLLTRS
jgi:acetate kinase